MTTFTFPTGYIGAPPTPSRTANVLLNDGTNTGSATVGSLLSLLNASDGTSAGLALSTNPTLGGTVTLSAVAVSSLMMTDASHHVVPVVLGTNLSLSGTTLNATGGSGTTYTPAAPITIASGVIGITTGTTAQSVALGNHTHSIYEATVNKGQVNGYAGLDGTGKVPSAQLPAASGGGWTPSGTQITSGSTYTMQATDYIVDVKKTSGSATTITLPGAPTLFAKYDIKDGKGDATTNHITVNVSGSQLFEDGTTSFTIQNNFDSYTLAYVAANQWRFV